MDQKILLILDLDETLVFASEHELTCAPPAFRAGIYCAYKRPFVDTFLAQMANWYDLAVWSSASGSYVLEVVRHLFETSAALQFVWSADRCTRRYDAETQEYYHAKDLSKAHRRGYPLERILIVDDSPEKVSRHYGNHIRVKPFLGDPSDTELRDLLSFLDQMRTRENVRVVEKRLWRERSKNL